MIIVACCTMSLALEEPEPSGGARTMKQAGTSADLDAFYAGHMEGDPFREVDAYLRTVSSAIGFPVDQLRYISCMVFSLVLSVLHRALLPDSPTVKHVYSLFFGFLFSWICFGVNTLVVFMLGVMCFAIVKQKIISPWWSPRIVFIIALALLSGMHIYRLRIDYGGYNLDVSGPLMIVVLKVTSFAWNCHDHSAKAPEKYAAQRATLAVDPDKVSALQYFAYLFYFGGYLAGPYFSFQDYIRFTDLTVYKEDGDRPSIASSIWPALERFLISVFCVVGVTVITPMFPLDFLFTSKASLPVSMVYSTVFVIVQRFKYYFAWKLAESSLILSGLGYVSRGKWFSNADILKVELADNMHMVMNSWNKSVNVWLRYYVYERSQESGCSSGTATIITFITSAFWHGFYGGYYLTFLFGALATNVARKMRRALRPLVVDAATNKTPLWYNICSTLVTMFSLNYYALSFVMLSVHDAIDAWRVTYFAGIMAIPITHVLLALLQATSWHKRRMRATKQKMKQN